MDPVSIITSYGPRFLDGTLMTLQLTGLGALMAAFISPFFALLRVSTPTAAQLPLRLYISFIRGTPLLVQLFLVYYGSGQFRPVLQEWGLWGFFRDPFNCALFTFVVNSTAYQTEILRGALMGVDLREVEAGKAIGMSRWRILQRIYFPHAYRIAWPALGNEIILLMKASALASVVTVFDLMGRTRQVFSRTFDFSSYLWAALIYLGITIIFVYVWRQMELRMTRHMQTKSSGAEGKQRHG
ncbi:ABC transporter permease [Granulosicoccus antarcticus]|uniref:Arginine ABC transporter permease protein ArtM n=1 Tax=Granulosicoccus antarcticus IMCC3135 TaxID=1192854 RepID=A0A2Z2NJV8_9GAMM|nr:ABC transporter permease subunit [Granulosicoccus antarcticus]ASJ71403.1 Octopine transport system permease protein OccM [Granulosicoccus antarcticus IMCC3135]